MSTLPDDLRPACRADLLTRQYGNDLLAWSPAHRSPTALDAVAAVMLELFDGEATVAELVDDVSDVIGIPPVVARNRIAGIIDQFEGAGLLLTSVADPEPDGRMDFFPWPPNP